MEFGWEFRSGEYRIAVNMEDQDAARKVAEKHFEGSPIDTDRAPQKVPKTIFEFFGCPANKFLTMKVFSN